MASALDVIRVVADMTLLGQTILNVWHVISPSSVPDTELQDDIPEMMNEIYSQINGVIDNELTYDAIRIFNVTGNQDLGIHAWPVLTTGSTAGETLPLGVAALLTLPTDIPKVRGRKFFGGIVESVCTNGVFISNVTDALADIAALVTVPYITAGHANAWVFGIPTLANGFQAFNSGLISSIPSYQRRRKQGVGA